MEIEGPPMLSSRAVRFQTGPSARGLRLSRCVADRIEGLSVRRAKQLIDRGWVFVDNQRTTKASCSVREGRWVEVYLHPTEEVRLRRQDILRESPAFVALNKPPGLLVHGTRGVTEETVLPRLEGLLKETGRWRPGKDSLTLVHRLDRDTSGVLLVARDARSARFLEDQFRRKTVEKRYLALVIGRPPKRRFRQVSVVRAKRPARASGGNHTKRWQTERSAGMPDPRGETDFEVLHTFSACTLLEARPLTGRTHQIRVHLAQLGHPVLGDIVYGSAKCEQRFFRAIPRQMLHASFLGVEDPDRGGRIELTAPLPEDMQQVLGWLKQEEGEH